MNMISLEVVFTYGCFSSAIDVWRLVEKILVKYEKSMIFDVHGGESKDYAEIYEQIKNEGVQGFHLRIGDAEISFGKLISKHFKCSVLTLKNVFYKDDDVEMQLVGVFCKAGFVQARLYDAEYDYWQNAYTISSYTHCGKSTETLPIISNGLPSPLERKIIDISSNPGRREYGDEFVSAVGSVMWLSERFWVLTGVSKEDVINASIVKSATLNSVTKIVVAEAVFESDKGREAELQNSLRNLLFRNCKTYLPGKRY